MLQQNTIDKIVALASASDLARYNWGGRGRAPAGYVKGMAVTYALCLQKLMAKDSAVLAMVRVVDGAHDVFDHYEGRLVAAGLVTDGASDVDRLRALFVVLTGLGMRESSGRYCEGRDRSASNTSAETAEAGLFQMSWDGRRASEEIRELFGGYPEEGFLAIFKEGVTPRDGDLENYGSGDGKAFQAMCKKLPSFAVECAAIGLRTLCTHWGPIVRREVELVPAADALFKQVQEIVGANVPAPAQKPGSGWLSALVRAVLALFRRAPTKQEKPLDLAERLDAAMRRHSYKLFTNPGEVNIIYVKGMDPDGTKNADAPDQFNDSRFVVTFEAGKPKIVGAWEGTVDPSRYWTENRMNPKGAARVKPGQYTAWQVGDHHGHEAWVQTGGNVTVCRDDNEDFSSVGDQEDTGAFGINMHGGYDLPKNSLGHSSAGCLVGRTMAGQREFMSITKADPRVKSNSRFVMTATILLASDV